MVKPKLALIFIHTILIIIPAITVINVKTIFNSHGHPYPQILLASLPKAHVLEGDVPTPLKKTFRPSLQKQMPYRQSRVYNRQAAMLEVGPGYRVGCPWHCAQDKN